jgi:hypothetical protein
VNFGEYLIEQSIIREPDLVRALEIQKTDKVALGQLALQSGLIDNKQLFRILSRQRKPDEKEKSFGRLAVEMQYLNPEQVEILLERQTHTNRLLGEILVSQGVVPRMELIKALKRFRSQNKKN